MTEKLIGKSKTIQVILPVELATEIEDLARVMGFTRSELCREILKNCLVSANSVGFSTKIAAWQEYLASKKANSEPEIEPKNGDGIDF